ncbi:MAG TPA: HYR domain-containing protein, partial [Phaeodactylibacter sp.]|nr:HYR domain-containing protein [Phaeodactylibacter sp.]
SAQVVYNTPTGADNLPGANTMLTNGEGSGADFPVGITTETYTVTDAAGNSESCSFVVTVNDAEAPQANCPTLAPVDNDAGQCGAVVNFTLPSLTDNCPGGSQSADYNSGDFFPVGTTTVTVTATDAAGNQDQCTFDVVVDDTEAPSMSCNNVTLVLDGSSGSITPAQVDGGSTDNCGVNSLSLDNGVFDCSTLGAQSVTLTAEDEAGNSNTCVATVTVEDNTAPTAACLSTTVEIQPDGTFTLQESDVYDSTNSTDNCGIDGVSFPAATYGCDDAGMSFSVGVTVTDASGNTGNCTANVSVTIGDDLPSGWASNDIGQVTVGNAYAYDPCTPTNGEFTITGSGNNAVSTTTDNVAFASQQLCGNGMITAKVESVTPNGYGGLMMRESSAAGSKQVAIFSNLTNVLRHERRTATNGPKTVQAFYRPFPIWLRLQRQGVWVFAYYSTTGSNFQYVHAVYAPMENCVEIGLASFTYLPNAQTETVFSNVSVEGSAALAGSGVPDFAQKETKQAGLQAELFPNPTSNAFILAFPEALTGEATAILRNQIGQVVAQRQLKPGDVTTEWDVRELPSGLYLLEVQWSNGFQTSFKVIRQ